MNDDLGMAKPLSGWRVLVPRPAGRGTDLADLLTEQGAEPVAVPLISVVPEVSAELDLAVRELSAGAFTWLAVTSAAAVASLVRRARALGTDCLIPPSTRVAAVGPGTARSLGQAGVRVDLLPDGPGSAETLLRSWPDPVPGDRVLLPQSRIARPRLADGLRAKGLDVLTVAAYRTIPCPPGAAITTELAAGGFDVVLLTSPSTVAALPAVHPGTVIAVIGSTTEAAARAAGLVPACVATEPSARGLVDALVRHRHRHQGKRKQ